jgi:hypothetical protein
LALPHHAAYIDQFGTAAAYHLLEELENKLLEELRNSIEGAHQDFESLKHARRIVDEVSKGTSDLPVEIQRMGNGVPPP